MRTRNLIVWLTLCLLAPACADETHGEKQVRAMVADRPAMTRIVSPGDTVWTWVARRFDGEGLSYRIYWDPTPPEGGATAQHFYPSQGRRATIRLRRSDHPSVLWSSAVFELLNQAGVEQFKHLNERTSKAHIPLRLAEGESAYRIPGAQEVAALWRDRLEKTRGVSRIQAGSGTVARQLARDLR